LIKDVPYLKSEDLPKVPLVLDGISSRFIHENRIIPIEFRNNILKIVMANPEDSATLDALRVATSSDVLVYAGDSKMVEDYISKFYGQESQI